MSSDGYVCTMGGRLVEYQVPVAFEEHGRLDCLLTAFYTKKWMKPFGLVLPQRRSGGFCRRRDDRIQDSHVSALYLNEVRDALRYAGRERPWTCRAKMAQELSIATIPLARRHASNLYLYHSYAYEAMRASYAHAPVRVVDQYHPHYDFEAEIIRRDAEHCGQPELAAWVDTRGDAESPLYKRLVDAWKYADMVICASSFTKQSLVWAGMDEKRCTVVPYGCDLPALDTDWSDRGSAPEEFHALFVGTGSSRKGLHHLLAAWSRLETKRRKRLTLVCGSLDPGLRMIAQQSEGVVCQEHVSQAELHQLYMQSDVFVMPSLVEGFGMVYVEALSYGCPVLGTRNTGLPDLGDEADGIFVVDAGDVDGLAARLDQLAETPVEEQQGHRRAARECAARHSWESYRKRLIACLPG